MKESIRTASVLEIYDTAIKELEKQKSELVTKRNILKTMNAGVSFVRFVVYAVLAIIIFSSFLLLTNMRSGASDKFIVVLVLLTIIALSVWGMLSYTKRVNRKAEDEKRLIDALNKKISELDNQISEKEARKKSLLSAEEVIVAKDMKVVQENVSTEKFSEETIKSESEKICPMCAETIKKAAKICRYCGHKFN